MVAEKSSARPVTLLVGTVKGLFVCTANARRTAWTLRGPLLGGWEVFSVCGDPRSGRWLVGAEAGGRGPTVQVSSDEGATWHSAARGPRLARGTPGALKHIWQIVPGHPAQPGTWYAGVDDAALFVSRDDGETWTELTGLTRHPTRSRWMPGAGGLCLHSIVVDPVNPQRLWVAMSAVGVWRSDDGGRTWQPRNHGLPSFAPPVGPEAEIGRCVHKLVLDPARPGALALQFHGGVFVSDDAGDSWRRISAGLPHDFGFPMAATTRGDFLVVPLLADTNRIVPDGALKIWRTRDRGRTWRALTRGLPQHHAFVGVLRDALAADPEDAAGVYFGTTGGELFCSDNHGDSWTQLPARLPRITTVKVWRRP